jgi:hypothetical protein
VCPKKLTYLLDSKIDLLAPSDELHQSIDELMTLFGCQFKIVRKLLSNGCGGMLRDSLPAM